MKKSDVKIGMKVVPFKKTHTTYSRAETSYILRNMKRKFVYVIAWDKEEGCWMLGLKKSSPEIECDYFNSGDFRPYEETK